jgi:hypothetical protein
MLGTVNDPLGVTQMRSLMPRLSVWAPRQRLLQQQKQGAPNVVASITRKLSLCVNIDIDGRAMITAGLDDHIEVPMTRMKAGNLFLKRTHPIQAV